MFGLNTSKRESNVSGQAALPFILLVAGIIVEVVVVGSIIAFLLSSTSLGEQLSARALAAASTGIDDVMMKAANNKEFASGGTTYSIDIGLDSVLVEVSRSSDNNNNVYVYTATSTATARNRQRRIGANFLVNQTTGEVSLQLIEEKPAE